MPQVVPTNINAYYRDLADAKQEVAVAQGKVDLLEQQIVAMGGELPTDGYTMPDEASEDTVTDSDVSAAETPSKSLSNMNRSELNAKATALGIESPESFATNKDVIEAIKGVK